MVVDAVDGIGEPTPEWAAEPMERSDSLRAARGILLATVLGAAFWGVVLLGLAWAFSA